MLATFSVGIALSPQDGSCAEELLKKADTAIVRTILAMA